jgi:selenide, water dikinase
MDASNPVVKDRVCVCVTLNLWRDFMRQNLTPAPGLRNQTLANPRSCRYAWQQPRKDRPIQALPLPAIADLVLIGGGHAHALVLRMWGMHPMPGVRLTLINPAPVAPYTGMLPGHIAGHYTRADMMIDLVRLARFANARLIIGHATGIDPTTKRIHLANRPAITYDTASIDTGITSDLPTIPGFKDHAFAAKPLGAYAEAWDKFLTHPPQNPKIVIIGAGIGGAELAMASLHRLRSIGTNPQVTLIDQNPDMLRGMGTRARNATLAKLTEMGVTLLPTTQITQINATSVQLQNGQTLPSDFTLSVASARPQDWLRQTGLSLTGGYLTLTPTLQTSNPQVFAAGDCAHLTHAPRPKAGVFAVRAAPVLFHNLRATLSGQALRQFNPQRDYLKLISTGSKSAIADRSGLSLQGAWLWRWKHHIDTKFMAKFTSYPAMPTPALPPNAALGLADLIAQKPLCGGCGAKVAPADLATALATLPAPNRPDVISGPGDDAAILMHGKGLQVITTDHLRAVTNDPYLMAKITAIHALGDIWAMGAAPQAALAQITLPPLGPKLQAETLRQIMAGAAEVITGAGADLVGGHTSQGAELTIGFTITGLTPHAITKTGAKPGDALILTKPIGIGTILAAEMANANLPGALLGEITATAYTQMLQPNAHAAKILSPHAHAMTDVTGFGLAGHLLEILQASNCAATLTLAQIPLLSGAEVLAAAGHASSLVPANRAATTPYIHFTESPAAALLFDPQTAGGLLAAVPSDQAETILATLGGQATIIGTLTQGPPMIHIT